MILGAMAEVRSGYAFRSRLQHEPRGSLAVVQMKDVDGANAVHMSSASRVTLPGLAEHHLLRSGDLVFRSRGRSNGAALISGQVGPAVVAAPLLLIRPSGVLPEYLAWYLNSPAAQAQLVAMAAGTSVAMISAESLRGLQVPIPQIEHQRRIAEIGALSLREGAIAQRIATLRQRRTVQLLLNLANEASA
jgi:hypothetical protein